MTGVERRAVAAGDEALIDAVLALQTAERAYARGGRLALALVMDSVRDLLVTEGQRIASKSDAAQ